MRDLDAALRALAAELEVAPAGDGLMGDGLVGDGLVAAVMERVAAEPVPARPSVWRRSGSWLRERWRRLVAVVAALVVVGALTPPVRASVAELFGFSGVIVSSRPGPGPSTASPPPPAGSLTLEQARRLVRFTPLLPSELGPPSGVEVSADRRLLSLSWTVRGTGVVRIDEFDGGLVPYFWKSVYDDAKRVTVADRDGLWLATPHDVVVVGGDGRARSLPPRVAGPTLVFELGGTTVRLEGATTLAEALAIGGTIR